MNLLSYNILIGVDHENKIWMLFFPWKLKFLVQYSGSLVFRDLWLSSEGVPGIKSYWGFKDLTVLTLQVICFCVSDGSYYTNFFWIILTAGKHSLKITLFFFIASLRNYIQTFKKAEQREPDCKKKKTIKKILFFLSPS